MNRVILRDPCMRSYRQLTVARSLLLFYLPPEKEASLLLEGTLFQNGIESKQEVTRIVCLLLKNDGNLSNIYIHFIGH